MSSIEVSEISLDFTQAIFRLPVFFFLQYALPIREIILGPAPLCLPKYPRRSSFKIPHIFHEAKAGPGTREITDAVKSDGSFCETRERANDFLRYTPGYDWINALFSADPRRFFPKNYYIQGVT